MTKSAGKSDRIKILMIPVLALVLLYVLMADGETTVPPATTHDQSLADHSVPAPQPAAVTDLPHLKQETGPKIQWPGESLSTIVAHNPLELRDPRVLLDRAFADAGLTSTAEMLEITAEEFFPTAAPAVLNDQEDEHLQQLYAMLAAEPERRTTTSDSVGDQDTAGHNHKTAHDQTEMPAHPTAQAARPLAESRRRAESERRTALAQRLSMLRNEPVTMFMKTKHGRSALLGDRKVTEGELIEDGIRISAIDRAGITFEIVETPRTEQNIRAVSEQ